MSSDLRSLSVDARDPEALAAFWEVLLARSRSGSVLGPAQDGGFAIRFVHRDEPRTPSSRMHFDLTSATAQDQSATVEQALSLGARHIDVGQRPEEGHVVLADPEGNEFCVIPAGNFFLADTGRIGALSCDGTRAVGLFWRDALGWPLVWDEGEETAIQSPAGGTKIAWGGPPVAPKHGVERLRFDLVVTGGSDLEQEVARLESLGARRLGHGHDGALVMADPDDNEFCLAPEPA